MLPIRLELEAFGPYIDTQIIEFSCLAESVFLIRGETGAGKTALLGAITFSLYGPTTAVTEAHWLQCAIYLPENIQHGCYLIFPFEAGSTGLDGNFPPTGKEAEVLIWINSIRSIQQPLWMKMEAGSLYLKIPGKAIWTIKQRN